MVAGDGACVPTPENCLYITLEKNETATSTYGLDRTDVQSSAYSGLRITQLKAD